MAVLVGTAGIILQAPTLYDDRQVLCLKYRRIVNLCFKDTLLPRFNFSSFFDILISLQPLDVLLSEIGLATARPMAGTR